ncbi:MAG: hypothetical protein ABI585_15025 [Betaproteobacteria bacterium]
MASPVLLLLGVPENGTSALADALGRAGAAIAGPPAGDPAGVSQHALAACGMRWDSLAPMPPKLAKSPGLDAARAAMDVFLERLPSDAPLLIAEPLATRIVALWRERIEEAGRPVAAILWLTHPGRAAATLARRRQFAPEKSLALWLAHLVEFEHATRGLARTILAEDVFLDDPAAGMKRIAQATRFPPAVQAAKAPAIPKESLVVPPPLGLGSGLDTALDQGYRKLASTVSGELRRAVDVLAVAARAGIQSAIPPWLAQEIDADRTRMQTLVDMAAGHAARADRTQRDLAAAPRDARALAAQVEALRAEQAREREALTGKLETLRGEQTDERARLADELQSTRAELARMTAALAEAPQSEATLRGELNQTQRDLNDERSSIAKLTDALETARREADGHAHRFESARHHLERFAVEIEQARAALAAREDLAARLAAEADGLRVREADLLLERDKLRRERDDAARSLERTKREFDQRAVERESTLHRATGALESAIEDRDNRIIALSEEADRMADAITEAAVRSAGLEEQLELRTDELSALQSRFGELAARLRELESRSLVRAARWLGGAKGAREDAASG